MESAAPEPGQVVPEVPVTSVEDIGVSAATQPGASEANPNPEIEKTQAVAAVEEKTQAVQSRTSQEEIDRRLAQELSRRGVPMDEVQRLVAIGRGETPAPPRGKAPPVVVAPPVIPPSEAFEPQPTITLPEFRDSTESERISADRMLTEANIARRRGRMADAEKQCRAALDLIPKDASALEMYGDILQALGRVDDAVYAYHRATEADAKRLSAEKKYAELTLMQNREIQLLREEFIPRNPTVAIVFSALFPGAGQVYNGDILKGILVAAIFIMSVIVLGWTNLGFASSHTQITPSLAFFMLLAGGTYIYGVVDANYSARRGKRPKSGWDV